ncbi:MAG TPA: HAMP domain-containing sensor histidine kinase [Polyangiaceae bacterium]
MKLAFRRALVVVVFVASWAAPYLFPFQALGVSLVARLGGAIWVAPDKLPVPEGQHPADPGWYVALACGIAWPLVLMWATVEELQRVERRGPRARPWPWGLAMIFGTAMALSSWVLWPSLCFFCAHWETSSCVVKVHHITLVDGGVAIAVPSTVVWFSRAVNRPIDVARVPLHRWAAGVALLLFLTPPFLLLAKSGQLVLFALAVSKMWLRELSLLEEKPAAGKWRIRAAAFAAGIASFVPGVLLADRLSAPSRESLLPLLHFFASIVVAGVGLAFVALCMSAADGLAWALGRAKSVRTRMLVLGLTSAGLAFALAGVYVPVSVTGKGGVTPNLVLTLVGKLVCAGIAVSAFSATLSRGLSRPLEQSVRAIAEIRRGYLGVCLDESGEDEVAAVARGFNQMVALLREAEFLEKINDDLRSRSTRLAEALESLRIAQADLVRSERMASVAALVKGIAHELNNPITYIAGNVAPLRRYCEFLTRIALELSDGRARTAVELAALTHLTDRKDIAFVADDLARLTSDIGEGARRAQLIISDLQSLTSVAQRPVESVDLHRVVRHTIALLAPSIAPGVRLESDLAPVPALLARAGQLEQLLVNLTDNALRAVGSKGIVRIHVGSVEDHVAIRVTDDGQGMPPDVKEQAFEPFFTTRAAGGGSGLGLAIVASIVRAHEGTVSLKSEPGKGTEIEVRLPLESNSSAGVADDDAERSDARTAARE